MSDMLNKLREHLNNTPKEELQKQWDEVVKQSEGIESPNVFKYIEFLKRNYPIYEKCNECKYFIK